MREDWIEKELGKVCFTTSGGTPSRKVSNYYEGDIPWVKSGELNHNVIRDTEEHISEEAVKNSSAKIFPEGTLLIALYGATIGKLAVLGIPATTNQAVCGIFKNGIFETKFLFNYLFHKKQKLIEQGAGGAQPNISQTILKKLFLPIAPLPEQRAIVAKIEQLFSELDNGIANLKAAKDKLEIYRQAVLKKAFEGDFTADWRRDQDFDPSWEDTVLGEIAKWGSGGTPSRKIDAYFTGDIPWLKTGELGPMHVDDAEEKITEEAILKSSAKIFPKGSVGIAMYGATIGKTSIFNAPLATNQACAVAQPNEDIDAVFLYYYLLSQKYDLIRKGQGGAQPNISQGILKEHPISVPKIEEQKQIIYEIESRLSVCDNILANIEEGLEKSEALRQSILKQAFEGMLLSEEELEACKQEQDWEPAEMLLKRIKNEEKVKSKKVSYA
jgi:type I restriction enzyme S subunit